MQRLRYNLALAIAMTSLVALLISSTTVYSKPDVSIDLKSRFNVEQQQNIEHWLEQGVAAVEDSIAPLPQRELKFTVLEYHSSWQAVPWGQVIRGWPDSVKLHIGRRVSLNQLINDWTLYHELAHLYLPYLDYPSFWLNEGFATYMQYIIMYQAGLLNRQQFISRMQAGFERGRRNTSTKPGKLKDVADDMWQLRAHKRVYWSGAAFFLEADLALQGKGKSLSQVIKAYVNCCRRSDSYGHRLVQHFDRLSQSNVFVPLFKHYAEREDFPVISKQQLVALADFYQAE